MTAKTITIASALRTNVKVSGRTMSLDDFAQSLGASDRVAKSVSEPFHQAWLKCDDEGKATMREHFQLSYIIGRLSVKPKHAQDILAMKREERNAANEAYEQAVNASGQKFRYHISREGKKTTANTQPVDADYSITRTQKSALMGALACFEGADLNAQINAAMKALKFLKAQSKA
jgi:hypothetical protein